MKVIGKDKVFKAVLAFVMVCSVVGCVISTPWRFKLIDGSNPQRPVFVLIGDDDPMPGTIYFEDTRKGGEESSMWTLLVVADKGTVSREITYGEIPSGMRDATLDKRGAKPLELNVLYVVTGLRGHFVTKRYFFMVMEENGNFVVKEVQR